MGVSRYTTRGALKVNKGGESKQLGRESPFCRLLGEKNIPGGGKEKIKRRVPISRGTKGKVGRKNKKKVRQVPLCKPFY